MNLRALLLRGTMFLTLAGFASDLEPNFHQMRVWTNSTGKSVRAACVAATEDSVTLMVPSGKRYVYEVRKLSAADQSYAAELERRQQLRQAPKSTQPKDYALARWHEEQLRQASGAHGTMRVVRCAHSAGRLTLPARGSGHASAKAKALKASWDRMFRSRSCEFGRLGLSY